MPGSSSKLKLIVRRDLPVGLQAAQIVHAYGDFREEHEAIAKSWRATSNTVVLLTVKGEPELLALQMRAAQAGIPHSLFYEPDLAGRDERGAPTALALAPSDEAHLLTKRLPLIGV